MTTDEARAAFVQVLLERVRQEKYPSATHMGILEETLPPEWIPAYVEVLLEKVAQDNHPSIPMMQRIRRILDAAP